MAASSFASDSLRRRIRSSAHRSRSRASVMQTTVPLCFSPVHPSFLSHGPYGCVQSFFTCSRRPLARPLPRQRPAAHAGWRPVTAGARGSPEQGPRSVPPATEPEQADDALKAQQRQAARDDGHQPDACARGQRDRQDQTGADHHER